MSEVLNSYWFSLFDSILPRFCCSCKTKLATSDKSICSNCLTEIKEIDDSRLQIEYDRKFGVKQIISDFFLSVFVRKR